METDGYGYDRRVRVICTCDDILRNIGGGGVMLDSGAIAGGLWAGLGEDVGDCAYEKAREDKVSEIEFNIVRLVRPLIFF